MKQVIIRYEPVIVCGCSVFVQCAGSFCASVQPDPYSGRRPGELLVSEYVSVLSGCCLWWVVCSLVLCVRSLCVISVCGQHNGNVIFGLASVVCWPRLGSVRTCESAWACVERFGFPVNQTNNFAVRR